jgi:hypothetical protein
MGWTGWDEEKDGNGATKAAPKAGKPAGRHAVEKTAFIISATRLCGRSSTEAVD